VYNITAKCIVLYILRVQTVFLKTHIYMARFNSSIESWWSFC